MADEDQSVADLIALANKRTHFFEPQQAVAAQLQPAWADISNTDHFNSLSSESKRKMANEWVQRELNETMPTLYKKKADQKSFEENLYAQMPQYKTPTRTWGDAGMDTLLGLRSGVASIAEMVGNLVNADAREFEGDPMAIGNALNPAAMKKVQEDLAAQESAALKDRKLAVAEIRQKKEQAGAGQWELFTTEFKESLARPQVAIDFAVKQLPTIATLILGGELVGAAAGVLGLGTRAVQAARAFGPLTPSMETAIAGKATSLAARLGAMGPGGAILSAGDVRGNVIEEFEKLKDEEWERVPEYLSRTAAGEDAAKVKHDIALAASRTPAALASLVGFVSGATGLMPPSAQVARGLLPAVGRGVAEAVGEVAEEVIAPIGANVQIAAAGAQPERSLVQDVGVTAAQALLGAGPFAAAATVTGTRPPTEAEQRGLPPPEAPQPPPEAPPPGPATRRAQIAEAVTGLEGNLATLEADQTIDPAIKDVTRAALQQQLAAWQASADQYENVKAAADVRSQLTESNDRADRILQSTLDDQTKQRLLAAEQKEQERLNRLNEVSQLDENELEKFIDDRAAALALADKTRGMGAAINRPQLTEEIDHADALIAQRAFVKTPTETEFAARARDRFPQDKSGNYEFPTVDDVESQPFQDAINTKRDIALALTNQLQTNPVSTVDERVRQIGTARRAVTEYRRIGDIFRLPPAQLDRMEADLTQALGATMLGRAAPERGTRIIELAAVIAAKNERAGGTPMSYAQAREQALERMAGLFRPPVITPPPTGTPPPGGQAGIPNKSFDPNAPTTMYDDVPAISEGEVAVRNATPEEQRLIDTAMQKSDKAGFPMKVLNVLGLRIGASDAGLKGVYFAGFDPRLYGLLGLNLRNTEYPKSPYGTEGTLVHEAAHAIDNALEGATWLSLREQAFAALRPEIAKAWGKGLGPLPEYTYPLAYNNYSDAAKQLELFAQSAKLYFFDKAALRSHAPRTYALMKEVFDGLEGLEQPTRQQIADVVLGAFSKVAVPGVGEPVGAASVVQERGVAGVAEQPAIGRPVGEGAGAAGAAEPSGSVLTEVRDAVDRYARSLGPGTQESRGDALIEDAIAQLESAAQAPAAEQAGAPGRGEIAAPAARREEGEPAARRAEPEGRVAPGPEPAPTAAETRAGERAAPREEGPALALSEVGYQGNGLEQPIEQMSTAYVGTGEGAIAYGWGLYFATIKDVAKSYRDKLAWRQGIKVGDRIIHGSDQKSGSLDERMLHDMWIDFVNGHAEFANRPADGLRALAALLRNSAEMKITVGQITPKKTLALARLADRWAGQSPERHREGMLYKVMLNVTPQNMLDLDKALSAQRDVAKKLNALPPRIKTLATDLAREQQLEDLDAERSLDLIDEAEYEERAAVIRNMKPDDLVTGHDYYLALNNSLATNEPALWESIGLTRRSVDASKAASLLLNEAGIPGNRYLDAESKAEGRGTQNYVIFDDALVSISQAALDFAQSAATKQNPTMSTKDAATRAVGRLFGIAPGSVKSRLPMISVIDSSVITNDVWMSPSGQTHKLPSSAQAWYDPASNTITVVADRTPAGNELAVIMHELFHKRGGQLLGKEMKQKFIREVLGWKNAPDGSIEKQVYEAAIARTEAATAGKSSTQRGITFSEELLPYAIEEAVIAGVKWTPAMSLEPGVAGMMARWFNAVKAALRNYFGITPDAISVADLMNAAYGAAALETVPGGGQELAARFLQARAATFERARQVEAKGLEYIPELREPMQRGAGTRPSQRPVPEDPGTEIMFSQVGPIQQAVTKAARSVYDGIINDTRAIKTEQQLDDFIKSERLPADSKIPRIRDEFIANWVDSQRPFFDWLRNNTLSSKVWNELKLVPGRMKSTMQRYNREVLNPVYAQVAKLADKHGMDYATAAEYAGQWATLRHIPEANAALDAKLRNRAINGDAAAARQLQINRKTQAGQVLAPDEKAALAGGLTDRAAADKMFQIEQKIPRSELEPIGNSIVNAFATLRDDAIKSGQLRPEWVKNFPKFKHYVALSGTPWDDTVNDFFGSNLSENRLREREGRSSLADPALLTLTERAARVAAYEASAPFKAELNTTYEGMSVQQREEAGFERTEIGAGSRGQGVVWQSPGQERYSFTWVDPKITAALQYQNRELADNFLLRAMQKATGLFSRMVTQWTMAFAPYNSIRDIQEKSTLIRSRGVRDSSGNLVEPNSLFRLSWKHYLDPKTWKAAHQIAFSKDNKADTRTAQGRMANNLIEMGGVSTWGETLERGRESLAEAVRAQSGKNLARVSARKIGDFVTNYNLMVEIVSSLSVNAAMRDLNVDPRQAAFQTLDLMNFRNSGAKTAWIRSMFAFFNPAVQSGTNLWKQLGTKRGLMDASVMYMLSFGLYNLAKGLGDDDEELGNSIDQRGAFEAERNVTIKLGDALLKVPVGFGAPQLAWSSAVNTARWMSGRYDTAEALGQQVTQFAKTFSPVPPSEVPALAQPVNFFFKTITPTVLKPAIDLVSDTNAWGQKLTAYYPDKKKFEAEQGRPGTPEFYKDLAEYARSTFGLDAYPEQWQTLLQGVFVGPPGAALKAWADRTKEQEGRPQDLVDKLPASSLLQVAGISRLFGRESRFLEARYYEQYNKALDSMREFKSADADGQGRAWLARNPERGALIRSIEAQEAVMRPLVKEYNQAIRDMQSGKVTADAARQKLEGLVRRKEQTMRKFLRAEREMIQYLPDVEDVEEEE